MRREIARSNTRGIDTRGNMARYWIPFSFFSLYFDFVLNVFSNVTFKGRMVKLLGLLLPEN